LEFPENPDKNAPEVTPPPAINPNLIRQRARRQQVSPQLDITAIIQGIESGDHVMLGKAITLIESHLPEHQEQAQKIIEACLAKAGKSIRLGVTGSPGVGKSTFIEALGMELIERGHQVAVLAIDPSSQISKGSILGDKTRMQALAAHPAAFIRPSAAGTSLGGVARKTRETILLCEVAGFDHILIETVGVGQSEIAVHSMVDFFILLLLPGAGDELQGIKRGIVEMADLLIINKADGDRIKLAKQAQRSYRNAIHLFPQKPSQWQPKVLTCSATEKTGISEIHSVIRSFVELAQRNQYFDNHRKQQANYWLMESIRDGLDHLFFTHPQIKTQLEAVKEKVLDGTWTSFKGAQFLLQLFRENG
jgi:LAO/AO transport system kinase